MKIRNLRIQRYKSLSDYQMNDIGNLVVLIGQNCSGKSNLLEALDLFFRGLGLSEGEETKLSRYHWYRMDASSPIEFELELELSEKDFEELFGTGFADRFPDKTPRLHIHRTIDNKSRWRTKEVGIGAVTLVRDDKAQSMESLMSDLNVVLPFVEVIALESIMGENMTPKFYGILASNNVAYPLDDRLAKLVKAGKVISLVEEPDKSGIASMFDNQPKQISDAPLSIENLGIPHPVRFLEKLQSYAKNLLLVMVPAVRNPLSFDRTPAIEDEIVDEAIDYFESTETEQVDFWHDFNEAFGSGVDGKLVPIKRKMFFEEGRRRYPFHYVGGGYQSWCLIAWQLVDQDAILLMEEPESSLHPQLAKTIFHSIRTYSESNQIFLTTHSTVFLDQCDFDEIWHLMRSDGVTKPVRIQDIDNLREMALLLGVRPSDVLMSNSILFVEGPADRIVIHAWAKLLRVPLEPPNVSVIAMGGIGKGRFHLGVWTEVALGAEVPMFMLLDGDSHAKKAAKKLKRRQKDKKRLIESDRVYNLERNDIEDYYPAHMFVETLTNRYSLNEEEKKKLSKAVDSESRVDPIRKVLWELRKVDEDTWKIAAAEYMAKNMQPEQLDEEICNLIHRIDDLFGR